MSRRPLGAIAIVVCIGSAPPAAAQPATAPSKPNTARAAPPDSAERERLLQQAAGLLAQGRRTESARLLQSAAERFGSVVALLQLARIQSGDGHAQAALASLQKARSIAPNSEEVLIAFAQVSLAARNPMPAIHTLRALTHICSTAPEYHYQLGVALMLAGDMPAAVEALERSEQLDPHNGLTLIALGLALNDQKRHGEAKPYLVRSLELTQESVDALAALAEAEAGLGEVALAETHARRALAMNGGHGVANLVMGQLLMRAERYGDARDVLLRAVATDPASHTAHYQLSLAYARLGDEANSRKHVDLYQQRLREAQERLRALRSGAGTMEPAR
jgi:tetratricopeptide (TPR) repeat protein